MLRQYKIRDYNFRLVLWLLVLSIMGVLLVGSAESTLQFRQLGGVILGLIVMVIVSLTDYSWIMNFYWIAYVGNIFMEVKHRPLYIIRTVLNKEDDNNE